MTNVAVSHGIDPRDYSLIAYGAAGPMLLPATLEYVKVKEIVVPPRPGPFFALGLVSSDLLYAASKSAYHVLTAEVADEVTDIFREMEEELWGNISQAPRDSAVFERTFDGRLVGQSWETPFVEAPPATSPPTERPIGSIGSKCPWLTSGRSTAS
ncbi:hydantoinase/oxoprolinase family protein [Rhodococcus opacus]|uniref:hydantoinase/oxoprolinase family protein n=1 Tax=Rhodococcus opacus TaxID=37919 RepID=UPI000EC721EB|nr:hydantoinase/oxoprolinase family protein [Rhodococcus opacus]QZS52729.1 hypothetical protein FXW36_00605 [Rhodococcus opacus]RKM65273.1 hypothetical protein COO55_40775 [Rhodococcus opacus]